MRHTRVAGLIRTRGRRRLSSELEAANEAVKAGESGDDRADALAEQVEAERERRVEQLGAVAARRIQQAGLARVWTMWADRQRDARRHRTILNAVGGRFKLPKVAASFGRWREGWRDEREEAAESRRRFSRDEREAEATAMREEIARLRSDLEAATDALPRSRH